MTVKDLAKFRQDLYELIENDDAILQRGDYKTADALTEAFLTGKVTFYYVPKQQELKWLSVEAMTTKKGRQKG